MITDILTAIHTNPSLLKGEHSDMKKFLKKQGKPGSQGTGNAPTDHESAFASMLENKGFKFLSKGSPIPSEDGKYYYYQSKSTQSSIDFVVVIVEMGKRTNYYFDLKHTKGKTFCFNDGWFEDDVIYIINFTDRKINKVYIGYGEETRTKKDHLAYATIRKFIKENNNILKDTEFLKIYLRLANKYPCKQFTTEFIDNKFKSVLKRITSSPPSSV